MLDSHLQRLEGRGTRCHLSVQEVELLQRNKPRPLTQLRPLSQAVRRQLGIPETSAAPPHPHFHGWKMAYYRRWGAWPLSVTAAQSTAVDVSPTSSCRADVFHKSGRSFWISSPLTAGHNKRRIPSFLHVALMNSRMRTTSVWRADANCPGGISARRQSCSGTETHVLHLSIRSKGQAEQRKPGSGSMTTSITCLMPGGGIVMAIRLRVHTNKEHFLLNRLQLSPRQQRHVLAH